MRGGGLWAQDVHGMAAGRAAAVPDHRAAAGAGRQRGHRGITPAEAARHAGISWPSAHDAFTDAADRALGEPAAPVAYLGIDEHRRGRPRWRRDDETGEYVQLADRWHTCFYDLSGKQGMLGQAEGRTADDAAYWLAGATPAWRDAVQVVAIDMCSIYLSAVRRMLPGATVTVDLFHIVQLAVKTLGDVRRRAIRDKYGRRGKSGDPEYGIKHLLERNLETLPPDQFAKIIATLDSDPDGQQIALAWIAKEKVACTSLLTYYFLGDRDLASFKGFVYSDLHSAVVVHDRYQNYDSFAGISHQLCCQHLLRDIEDAAESYPEETRPGQIADALRGLIHAANVAGDRGMSTVPAETTAEHLKLFRHGVRVGLSQVRRVPGAKTKQPPTRTLLESLRDREADVLRFLTDTAIPPTSNQAERDLRPSKTQQKISDRLRSEKATRDRYAIRGYASTAAKHGVAVFTAIRDALDGNPWIPPIPADA